jgi:hypothetical protein
MDYTFPQNDNSHNGESLLEVCGMMDLHVPTKSLSSLRDYGLHVSTNSLTTPLTPPGSIRNLKKVKTLPSVFRISFLYKLSLSDMRMMMRSLPAGATKENLCP